MTKWQFKDGKRYTGPTHEIAGRVFSGATRTPESRPLVPVEPKLKATPKSQLTTPSRPKRPRKKPAPKPKGATAWD